MMRKAIIIPIYLRPSEAEGLPDLEALGLAKRAIEGLKRLKDQDFTLILPVCFDLDGEGEEATFLKMDKFFKEEVRRLRQEKTLVFSSYHLKHLREYLVQKGFGNFSFLNDLKGFSKIRNVGLLLAQALSMDLAIFIDHDEVIEDSDYLETACDYLTRRWNGKEVVGKGGFYINPDGAIFLRPQRLWWRFLWNKTKWMNRVWEKILSSKERLVPSPMLLGGNLVLHRDVFRSIPFDPYIPRGEDTDYLINARQMGFCLLFDKKLRIKHLHPERTEVYFQEELRLDIERFLYERGKTRKESSIHLDPYPGHFLNWTLCPRAILTSLFLSLDYLFRGKWTAARESMRNIHLTLMRRDGGWLRYFKFKADWRRVMGEIQEEGLSGILERCWV